MDFSFSEALALQGMSSTTRLVVKSMITFLVVLILAAAFILKKQFDHSQTQKGPSVKNKLRSKGF